MQITDILVQLGFDPGDESFRISPFQNEEDGSDYAVWRITAGGTDYVLKKAKGYEAEIYEIFLDNQGKCVPRLYDTVRNQDDVYLLMEYVPGETLRRCTRDRLIPALDALIALQDHYWEHQGVGNTGHSIEKSLPGRINRGKFLNDSQLEEAYEAYLQLFSRLPRTLCHDDLLPFNVLVSEERAAIIDWEYAGMLPYPTSLARLIAHGEEGDSAFFYLTEADREFAARYYYHRLVQKKSISYEDYRAALDCFLFYEYCEWVMLGIRYGTTDSERYRKYFKLAKQQAHKIIRSRSSGS